MGKSLQNYTLRHLVVILLAIIALWAGVFYAFILEEIYDNVDDGLKNQKINIIREAYANPDIYSVNEFGINQFRVTPTDTIQKQNVFSKEMIYMEYDDEMEPYRVLRTGFYAPDGKPYSLEIRTSTVEEDDFLINLSIALTALYVMILISIYVVNFFVLKNALGPFKDIIEYLQSYRFGATNKPVPAKSTVQEFTILGDKLQEMIGRNERLFLQQKQFIENASHELQTPLAIAINKMELLLEDPSLEEKHLTELNDTKGVLHRLVSLNKSLLMLSKIDNRQFEATEKVSLNSVFRELQEEFREIIEFKEIFLTLDDKADFEIQMNRNLASILLSNLLRNSIRYNKKEGKIAVTIDKNEFSIANTSSLPALNPTAIFERFYKFSQDSNATGLGLSIVESIINTYSELEVIYRYSQSLHIFSIKRKK